MKGVTFDEVGSKSKASKAAKAPTQVKAPNPVARMLASAAASPGRWAAITCVLLAISGGYRYWLHAEFSGRVEAARKSPFPLADLPMAVGTWQMVNGTDEILDPEIAQFAGASDHLVRSYVDEKTGESIIVLVVYGIATDVAYHVAELCYPAAGFTPLGPMSDYTLKVDGLDKPLHYRGGFYTKKTATEGSSRVEVIYSFRFADDWVTDTRAAWKKSRSHPGMYKIQISRPVVEPDIASSPSVALMGDFVKEIEKQLKRVSAESEKAVGAGQATPKKG